MEKQHFLTKVKVNASQVPARSELSAKAQGEQSVAYDRFRPTMLGQHGVGSSDPAPRDTERYPAIIPKDRIDDGYDSFWSTKRVASGVRVFTIGWRPQFDCRRPTKVFGMRW